jgi:hypothetical protein
VAGSAKVSSLDGLRDFRAAMVEFQELAKMSLGEVDADLQRTISWLKSDREHYWTSMIRKRGNEVTQAKNDLFRKQLQGREGERPSCVDEKKALEAAQRALLDAEQRLEATKRWQRLLDREMTMYKGQVQQLARALDTDVPMALIQMDRMLDSLDKYVRLVAPSVDDARAVAALEEVDNAPLAAAAGAEKAVVSEFAGLRMNSPGRGVRDTLALGGAVDGSPGAALPPAEIAALKSVNPAIDPPDDYDKIVLAPEVLKRRRYYVERLEFSSHGDSGWYIGAAPCDPPGMKYVSTAVFTVLAKRPDLAEVLNLPRGWMAVIDDGRVIAILDHVNREVLVNEP